MDIEYVAFFATKAEADAFNGDFGGGNNPPTDDVNVFFYTVALASLVTAFFKRKYLYI